MSKKEENNTVVEAKRDVLSAYRLWLNNIIANDISPIYGQVLATLWRTEFFAEFENDENRKGDIFVLRDEFANESKLTNAEYLKLKSTPVRILEVMISLSKRINDIVTTENNVNIYFWEMISSLELNKMDDGNFNASTVQRKLDIFLGHKYRRNGRGGLFFIKNIDPSYNATALDLWTQAMAYINSKRGI